MAFPTTGLVSYWRLDESTGTRVDSHGTNHLTPNGTVTAPAGKLSNGAGFAGASTLRVPSNASLQTGDIAFTITCWINVAASAVHHAIAKDNVTTSREYQIFYSGNSFIFEVNGGPAITSEVAAVSTWHFVVAARNQSTGEISIQLNNGPVSTGAAVIPIVGTADFSIGGLTSGGHWFTGIIDEVGFWKRVLTAQERTDLWNGGAGLAYAPPAPPVFPTANLVSYWRLDEASGTRQDSHGTNHLTPTNAPVGAAGKIGNGCDFESSSSQYLSHADPTPLGDEDFTYSLWFKRESTGARIGLIGKDGSGIRSYSLESTGGDANLSFYLQDGAGTVFVGGIGDTNWHFAVAWHNAAANTLNIQVDNGTVGSSGTGGTAPIANPTVPVRIGSRGTTGDESHFDGLIDEVGLWRRVLTAQERTDLYNGGAGLAYAPPAPPVFPTANLVSYWKLDEASGTRQDSHGTNHLTPTNAPVGAAGKIGNGCDFESSSAQYLSHADPNPLLDENFTYTLWFKRESAGVGGILIGKDYAAGRHYTISTTGGNLTATLFLAGPVTVSSVIPSDTAWHFICVWYDQTLHTLNSQLDNGTPTTLACSTGPALDPISSLRIGSREYAGFEEYFDGLIDEVGLWRRVLTAQERTDLYNGGAGLAYPPPVPEAPTLTSLAPTQGVQGSTVAVTLTGTAFVVGATTVTVGGSGVTVTTVVVSSATSLTANFVLEPTAAATARPVTVTTDGGTSGARLFTVTALPVEPPEPGELADSSLVDTALIALLAADAQLATMLPGGVHFGLAPQGVTAFALVAIDETAELGVFDLVPAKRRAIEQITYAVQAVLPTSAMAPVTQAAARIDALLQDQPLTIPGYGWLSTVRVERLRPAGEPDAGDKNIRWQHAGGRYRVQVTPAV